MYDDILIVELECHRDDARRSLVHFAQEEELEREVAEFVEDDEVGVAMPDLLLELPDRQVGSAQAIAKFARERCEKLDRNFGVAFAQYRERLLA